jgi:hypothetical protein
MAGLSRTVSHSPGECQSGQAGTPVVLVIVSCLGYLECSIGCGLHGYGSGLHTWQAGKPAVSVLCCLDVLCLIV